jgi:hypothetical protein
MGKRDARIDAYIAKSAEFARPVLKHLRAVVHAACPTVEETMKWGAPFFMHQGVLCSMASFKQHCAFGFWKGTLVIGSDGKSAEAMGQFGRITKLSELPPRRTLAALVKRAMALNEAGVPSPTRSKPRRTDRPKPPADFLNALKKYPKALVHYEACSPSHQREYIEWLVAAKRPATRARRLARSIEWLGEGKSLNWKYERPKRRTA